MTHTNPDQPTPQPLSDCGDPNAISRRHFLALGATGASLAALSRALPAIAGPFAAQDTRDHFVPVDKKLTPDWVRALFGKGDRTWYERNDLATIGMPIGGICAGLVYLTGEGRLVYWDIFNQNHNTGPGSVNYKVGRKPIEVVGGSQITLAPDVDQGFAITVKADGPAQTRALDLEAFPGLQFCGEYPLGWVRYKDGAFPVEVELEAFSPFIPLNARDSALPATVLNYKVKNTSEAKVTATVGGWLENVACLHSAPLFADQARRTKTRIKGGKFVGEVLGVTLDKPEREAEPPTVFADFEGADYGDWQVEGEAFGKGPAPGTLPAQQKVTGFKGKGLVNSFLGGDDGMTGKLTSPEFTIERPYISFLIGGGSYAGSTCINLVVDGKTVRTATGADRELLVPHNWVVRDLIGKRARLEIVDQETGGWGHINVDQIEFRDEPMVGEIGEFEKLADYGTLCLAAIGAGDVGSSVPAAVRNLSPTDEAHRATVSQTVELAPGEEAALKFVVAWCMPNMPFRNTLVGNNYAERFANAGEVARYVADNYDRLAGQTRLWHDTYYDSTLPHWLLDRLHSTVSNLATTTCQWWRNGRFWAWEGCGSCHGTCGHVWNYEHALARLFPELERSVREMQDFAPGIGFDPETGAIAFRGEGWNMWAGDAQGGYILKAYREHLVSSSNAFLRRNWANIKKAVQFLLKQDANDDGLIEGRQHQTYDQDYYGANTMVGSLYLGALRAAEEMARQVGDSDFAGHCRAVFESGSRKSVERLFNGEYFEQDVDLEKHPDWQYADGCLADQLFGQGWAHQVGLGYVYPKETVVSALTSVWKYCWAPDIGPQNKAHKPQRWFAYPGEAGLLTCTWPRSKHLGPRSTCYRDEVWTGIEYQVAGHMAWEGMLTEALAICRGVHERYHPSKHNPWNEIECGDHYARALASWGVLIGLAGFEYDGAGGRIGFAPRITPEEFRSVFTAAEGWGTIAQHREGDRQADKIEVRWGTLRARELRFELPEAADLAKATVEVAGKRVAASSSQEGRKVTLRLETEAAVREGETVAVELSW
jgi:non-lysosomal glucosylceramidase